MVTVEEAVIAKMDKSGKHFEVLVDPELAYALREGRSVSVQRMIAANMIFIDAHKGTKCSSNDILSVFGTHDMEAIAQEIVRHGDVQLTTDFRREKTEEKRKQVANIISRNAFDPHTKTPHPFGRILNAMEQVKINIDPFKPADQQVDDVLKKLKEIMPISMEEIQVEVQVDAAHSGRVYGILKEFGTIKKDSWDSAGGLAAVVSIPAGVKERFYSSLNAATGGTVRIVEKK